MSGFDRNFGKRALGVAAAAFLVLSGGMSTASAVTKACNGAFCAESFRIVERGSHAIRFSFRGSSVNHYNVRFVERGGRTVQKEIGTFSGSNESKSWRVRAANGTKVTISVQACNRALFGSSKCTPWKEITLTLA